MEDKKFVLRIGRHRGSLMSRESTEKGYYSYEAAYMAYHAHRAFYRSIGYQVWFADIVAPDGTKTHLEHNPCYS
ncbi:MAG TPA: hypothetical protein VK897_25595 [Anaerolineales bacterium]|nr:hypothetical protein [Anaerolineales bacterium]